MTQLLSASDAETIQIGRKIAASVLGGDVIALAGSLGAGKTTLTKGIARYFGIAREITSPTFTLMNVYSLPKIKKGIHTLAHIDTYRLKNVEELLAIGVQDFLGRQGILTVVEWPGKMQSLLKDCRVTHITISDIKRGKRIKLVTAGEVSHQTP